MLCLMGPFFIWLCCYRHGRKTTSGRFRLPQCKRLEKLGVEVGYDDTCSIDNGNNTLSCLVLVEPGTAYTDILTQWTSEEKYYTSISSGARLLTRSRFCKSTSLNQTTSCIYRGCMGPAAVGKPGPPCPGIVSLCQGGSTIYHKCVWVEKMAESIKHAIC